MKLLTFDMDNTLIHSDKAHVHAFNLALEKLGFKKKKSWEIEKHFGKPKLEVAKAVLPDNTPLIQKKFFLLHDKYLYNETKKYTTRIKGVLTAIKKLKKHYKLAVLSNCRHSNIKLLLTSSNLDPSLFDILIGGDEAKPKPSPDEIFKAQKLMKQKPSYHVGDSIYDIRAAKKAKVKSIAVLTGFFTRAQLKKENPNIIAESVSHLPDILLK